MKKNKKFFLAAPGSMYLPSTKVKAILDYDAQVTKNIFKKAELSDLVEILVTEHQSRRTLIWMDNDTYYVTETATTSINRRVNESGTETICVGRGFFIPIDHIMGVFDFGSNYAMKLRKKTELLQDKFSFVQNVRKKQNENILDDEECSKTNGKLSKSRSRSSTIVLTSGENISVVYTPKTIISKLTK